MKNSASNIGGKVIYSLIFLVILPLILIFWAKYAEHAVSLPAVYSEPWGLALAVAGGLLMLAGMFALWRFGKGLPMNAYPPEHYVQMGVYRYFSHPIYLGFGMLCFGVSIFTGSAAGLWLVSPVVVMGMAALVWGYEILDLKTRFPDMVQNFRFGAPPNQPDAPKWYHRIAVLLGLLLPWVLLNGLAGWAHVTEGPHDPVFFDLKNTIPILWQQALAVVAVGWILLALVFAASQMQLRKFYFRGVVGGLTVLYLAFIFPNFGMGHWVGEGVGQPFVAQAILSVSWFCIWVAEEVYRKAFRKIKWLFPPVAGLLSIAVVLNSAHPISHTLVGALAFLMAFFYPLIWEFLREKTEGFANSWKEWRFGPMRLINHGLYVGLGAFLGAVIGGLLAGEAYVFPMVVFGVVVTVVSGLWAQIIEGSAKLKRPFGFYGGMVGIVFASLVMWLMGVNVWVMLGIFSVFMPFVQGIGRLRCLINGCCHGAETSEKLGIRYFHPRSRVCFISNMKGKHLHPTPLYSLIWLFLTGGVQISLWLGGAELSLIFATYLILNGLGRFVEEAYRGEPQTPMMGKLRLYQVAAMASILIGIVISLFQVPMPTLADGITWRTFAWAGVMALLVTFAMGIDFPESEKRFSRLT